MPSNKSTQRNIRGGGTTVIPLGSMPRARGGFFGGEGLGPPGVLFCVLFCAAAAAIMDYGVIPPPYTAQMRSPIDFTARAAFTYLDQNESTARREDASERALHVYVEEEDWEDKILGDLEKLAVIVDDSEDENTAREKAAAINKTYISLVSDMYRKKGPDLARVLSQLRTEVKRQFAEHAILSVEHYPMEVNKREPRRLIAISIRNGKPVQREIPAQNYRRLIDALEAMKSACNRDSTPSLKALQWQLAAYLESKIHPNLSYDAAATEKNQTEEVTKIRETEVSVKEGDFILKKNVIVKASTLEKLRQEYRAVKARMQWPERLRRLAGLFALAAGVLAAFFIIAGRVEPEIWERRRALVMLGLFSLCGLAACRSLSLAGLSLVYAPFVFIGMAASLAFGQVVALLTLMGLSFLAAFSAVCWEAAPIDGGMAFFSLAMLLGGIAAALPAEKLRDRWDLLKYGVLGGLLQGTLIAGMSLLTSSVSSGGAEAADAVAAWPRAGLPVLLDAIVAYVNGPVCGLLALGSLPLIESLFGILTNIRLFELADMNQPALRLIQLEAPGTFAHTLQVRFLAEPASDAIGAHTRLVSAGVLYHDLGKTLRPEYFVENTPEAELRHKRLKPSASALLITAHVKDGIDLAHEYNLPQQIIDFIPEHHGTTLVSYFYHSAVRDAEKDAQAEGGNGGEVQESFFRYPGPKPRTRETAIVMLADTIEAASRTLQNPSATRLRQFVHELLMAKMLDNQLDDCTLTFADLALIEDAFLRVLATRFHSRIRYPGQEGEEELDGLEPEKDKEKDEK